jgi:predicted nucleic acid-binding protein
MRIYFDNCCFNRPYDEQSQVRVIMESEAVLSIIDSCAKVDGWGFYSSDVLDDEIDQNLDMIRKLQVLNLYCSAVEHIDINDEIIQRAGCFAQQGIKPYDALHLASAEYAGADALLTTDKKFINQARILEVTPRVANPLEWLLEVLDEC